MRELGGCMDAFRERVAFVIENGVPLTQQLTERITSACAEHSQLLVRCHCAHGYDITVGAGVS